MTDPRKDPPEPLRAADIADAQAVTEGRMRLEDVSVAAQAWLLAEGPPPSDDPPASG